MSANTDLLTVLQQLTSAQHDHLLIAYAASLTGSPAGSLPYVPMTVEQEATATRLIALGLLSADGVVTPLGEAVIAYDFVISRMFFTPDDPPEAMLVVAR